MTGKMFISDRRSDSRAWAEPVYERLVGRFGRKNVFLDVYETAPSGTHWKVWLGNEIATCDLMLVLIGHRWTDDFILRNEFVKEGIHDRDYVRFESTSALSRAIPMIPVLQGDAQMPHYSQLPHDLRTLTELEAARLRGPLFDSDVQMLISRIEGYQDRNRRSWWKFWS